MGKKKLGNKLNSNFSMWMMISPYLLLLLLFGLIPVIMAFLEIPKKTNINRQGGFHTFSVVLHDFRFFPAIAHVAGYMLIFVPATIFFVVLMALMLDVKSSPWKKYLRLAYIVPASVSGGVAVLVWYVIFAPSLSPYRVLLHAFHVTESNQIWQTKNLIILLPIMAFFSTTGYWILIQYGSLQSISHEVIEAARVDGCSAFQLAVRIKLPLIKKYLVYMGVLVFAAGLQLFVEPQLLNDGFYKGIAQAWSVDQLSYSLAFFNSEFGQAAAISILLLIPSLLGALIVIFKTDMFEDANLRTKKIEEA